MGVCRGKEREGGEGGKEEGRVGGLCGACELGGG